MRRKLIDLLGVSGLGLLSAGVALEWGLPIAAIVLGAALLGLSIAGARHG